MISTILAVETSTVACSVALLCGDKVFQRYEELPQKHAHRVLEMVDEVLTGAGVSGQAIDLLAYGEGPGAFTGIRIAAGVIQGLALGWDKPVVGVSSLEAMAECVLSAQQESKNSAQNTLEKIKWCALMDARMQEVYIQTGVYSLNDQTWQVDDPKLVSPADAETTITQLGGQSIGLGDIKQVYPGLASLFLNWNDVLPSALSIARIAKRMHLSGWSLQEKVPVPIYLRNHVADTIEERAQKKMGR